MGRALEVVSGRVTNPGATITPLTANTGDSFTIRSSPPESAVFLAAAWAQEGTVGVFRIRSPRIHDSTQGIRLRVPVASHARNLLTYGALQRLFPQDTLTVELSGGATETDVGALLIYYTDLPGSDARLATWQEVAPRIRHVMGAEQNLTTGATAGDYGGAQALNADFDLWKRNVDYAILGYLTDVAVGIVGIKGADTANMRVAGPGTTEALVTANWFVDLSQETGLPCIPIINGANVGTTTIDLVHTAASAAVNVTLICAELGG